MSDYGSKLLSSFLMSAIYSFLKYLRYTHISSAVSAQLWAPFNGSL